MALYYRMKLVFREIPQLHTWYARTSVNPLTPPTSVVLEGDEGRDGRCLVNGDRLYFSSSVPGPQEVDEQFISKPVLLDVCGETAHPDRPARLRHLLAETQSSLLRRRGKVGGKEKKSQSFHFLSPSSDLKR